MKLTREDIENVQRQIDELKSKFEENKTKPNKWKLPDYEDGAKWIAVFQSSIYSEGDKDYTKVGRRRATKELAERCAEASRTRDLLEAWRDYLHPTWEDCNCKYVYSIYLRDGYYMVGSNEYARTLGTVYMGKHTAEKICNALNNKNISL